MRQCIPCTARILDDVDEERDNPTYVYIIVIYLIHLQTHKHNA